MPGPYAAAEKSALCDVEIAAHPRNTADRPRLPRSLNGNERSIVCKLAQQSASFYRRTPLQGPSLGGPRTTPRLSSADLAPGRMGSMRFVLLTAKAYARFLQESRPRVFIPQSIEFARVRERQGHKVEYVGVVDDAERKVVGAGVLAYQPWKKVFWRAQLAYGPLLDWENTAAIEAFFTGLKRHLKRNPRVLALRFNPLLPRAFYEDIKVVKVNPVAAKAQKAFARLGATRLTKEFYEQPDIQIRYIYTKDISGKTFDEATATLAKGLRRRFHNEGRYGVETRLLPPEEFDVFDRLHESTADRTTMHGISGSSRAFYTELMRELGPKRALLCVAYLSPSRYLGQIADERQESLKRIELLEGRKATKARDRELEQLRERLTTLDSQEEQARKTLDEHGDDIPFNAALSFRFGDELILLLGGMDKRFAAYGRDYPVERAMFKWACDNGLSVYNTFGVSGIFDETAPDAPVLKFKRWLGGNVEEFVGTYVLPIHPLLAKATGALG